MDLILSDEGYSWKTNQYGLTVDNVVAYELVLPSGTITKVSESSEPDLFFALKGGFNNFVSLSFCNGVRSINCGNF